MAGNTDKTDTKGCISVAKCTYMCRHKWSLLCPRSSAAFKLRASEVVLGLYDLFCGSRLKTVQELSQQIRNARTSTQFLIRMAINCWARSENTLLAKLSQTRRKYHKIFYWKIYYITITDLSLMSCDIKLCKNMELL